MADRRNFGEPMMADYDAHQATRLDDTTQIPRSQLYLWAGFLAWWGGFALLVYITSFFKRHPGVSAVQYPGKGKSHYTFDIEWVATILDVLRGCRINTCSFIHISNSTSSAYGDDHRCWKMRRWSKTVFENPTQVVNLLAKIEWNHTWGRRETYGIYVPTVERSRHWHGRDLLKREVSKFHAAQATTSSI